jgi:hypothetical protein
MYAYMQIADVILLVRWNVAVSANWATVSDLVWLILTAQIRFSILLQVDKSSFRNEKDG